MRVIGPEGEQVGIVSREDALRMAEEAGVDLVEIAPQADPPVCRVMDYGKHLFEESKRKASARICANFFGFGRRSIPCGVSHSPPNIQNTQFFVERTQILSKYCRCEAGAFRLYC